MKACTSDFNRDAAKNVNCHEKGAIMGRFREKDGENEGEGWGGAATP
jgi:hypothetical protein